MASAWAVSEDTLAAANAACDRLLTRVGGPVDLLLVFFTPHHTPRADELAGVLRERLRPGTLVGLSAVSVIGDGTEIENAPGVSLLALRAPGLACRAIPIDDLPGTPSPEDARESWRGPLGVTDDLRAILVLADPFSVPIAHVLACMNAAIEGPARKPAVFGGMASGAERAGGNAFLLDDRIIRTGGVLVTLTGGVHIDTVVSQGCRPIGRPMVITKARKNILFELGGEPAAEAIQNILSAQGDSAKELIKQGLFLGIVVDEYKPRFGRGDFLIRAMLGVDAAHGAVAVGELLRVGQTVRLHVRDVKTASEDLSLLLDAQKLYDPPLGSLLVTCTGRGSALFGGRDHDASAVIRAFQDARAGEVLAAPGAYVDPATAPPIPQAGFFAQGEIGPIGGRSFVHGHTACVALFRA